MNSVNKYLQNRNLVLVAGVLVLVIVVGGLFLFSRRSQSTTATANPQPTQEVVPTIMPEDLGFTLTVLSGNKKVVLEVSNTDDLTAIDYELSYTSKGDIPRGAIGHIDVKTPGKLIRQEIVLGTCSDVCHYDEDVSNIKLVLKITKTDGKVFSSEQTLEL